MKVFAVIGYTKSGKTTTIEEVIKELKRRNYTVGSVKDIHFEGFHIDMEGTNTDRHKKAGSELVVARGFDETDVLFQERLDIEKIAKFYEVDYLILEGVSEANVPIVLTADCIEDLDKRFDDRVFLISGKISDDISTYRGLEAISALEDIKSLVDIIEKKVFPMLPDFDSKCCSKCGYNCRELCKRIVRGKSEFSECTVLNDKISLKIDGKEIIMVPFVQTLLKNTVKAIVSELDGYTKNSCIEIDLRE